MAEDEKVVMLVDDEPSILEMYGVGLERRGYRVVKVGAAPVALQRARELGRIDVLVTDVVLLGAAQFAKSQKLPALHGIELMRRMFEIQPDIKVILFSGYAQDMIRKLGGIPPPGAVFLQKPFTVEALANTIERVLSKPAPARKKRR